MTLDLFSYAADRAADQGIQQAADGAGPDAIKNAVKAVLEVARSLPEFTAEDVRRRFGDFGMPEPRAWGAGMRAAAATGKGAPTDRYRKTGRISSHNRPMRIWSRLYNVDIK